MNKDAILASAIGFGIGLVITGAILLGPNIVTKLKTIKRPTGTVESMTTQNGGTPKPTPQVTSIFTIDSPTSETILNSDKVTVSGKAPAGTIMVVGGLIDESVVEATTGAYSTTISVKEGKNEITVANVADSATEQKIVVYMTP